MEESCVPPGFRFHPTEEELVGYYLARKVASQNIDLDIIKEVDLYRIEPWDLQGRCKYGHDQEQKEWYFFSYKDRKYPSGTRTNRATVAGFWKATGRDKPVVSGLSLIGMRKTLVFYRGRAPNGRKTDWIIHEYRLQSCNRAPAQEEGWVVCRAFQKPSPNHQRPFFPNYYQEHSNAVPSYISGTTTDQFMEPHSLVQYSSSSSHCGSENFEPKAQFFDDVPQLESPEIGYNIVQRSGNLDHGVTQEQAAPSATTAIDWNFLDSLLHEQSSSKNSY